VRSSSPVFARTFTQSAYSSAVSSSVLMQMTNAPGPFLGIDSLPPRSFWNRNLSP
jgi:hypothetical protein